jgi:hypothetical protein
MDHLDMLHMFGIIGLLFVALSAIRQYRSGRLRGTALILLSVGLGLWAIGLALSLAKI